MWAILILSLALIFNVNAQTDFCITGYIMDTFCIDLGTLLDKPNLRSLQFPAQHSIHCLVEVPSCVESGYEVLSAPPTGKTDYVRAVKLDSNGNTKVVAMAKSIGICGTCSGKGTVQQGFRATVKGKINKSTTPPTLTVSEVLPATVTCPVTPTFCFSGETTVDVKDIGTILMQDLKLGNEVLVSEDRYEKVYSFGHRHETINAEFLQFLPSKMEISTDHMVKIKNRGFLPASSVMVGDELVTANGNHATIESITPVVRQGVYAPFTNSGTIVVSGIQASSYVAFQGSEYLHIGGVKTFLSFQYIAHLSQAPHRLYCRVLGIDNDETYTPDGMSTWINTPHQYWQWFLHQNAFVMILCLIPAILCLMLIAMLDGTLAYVM